MSTINWLDNNDNWNTPADWSSGAVPGSADDVTIAQGDPDVTTNVGTVNSVSITNSGRAFIDNGGAVATTGAVTNAGTINVDIFSGEGGSSLTVGGGLTNNGRLQIGDAQLSANDSVTAASLANTGTIELDGSASNQATLNVAGAAGFGAAGVVSGNVSLNNDTLIAFGSGEIASIAGGASLAIDGANARVADSSNTTSNSALTGLADNAGTFYLENGASVSTTGALTNEGTINVDIFSGMGGSSLTVGGALTNSGRLQIGDGQLSANDSVTAASLANTGTIELDGSANNQATLNVAGAAGFGAAGVVSGNVSLNNDTLIAFGSGEITSIASGASLGINGANARVADSSSTTSNSALTGLADNAGTFYLENGASLSPTGAFTNDGTINVDIFSGMGGSSLAISGALTNGGRLQIGDGQLSANDSVSAASLANTGTIELDGSVNNQARLNVAAAAGFGTAGVVSGTVTLSGDTLIAFGGGQIASIASGASLAIDGTNAYVADSSALASNSALTGLTSNAGTLYLENGALVSPTGAFTNDGTINIDIFSGMGGSSLAISGALTNNGRLQIGDGQLSANDSVSATSLANTGTIELDGSASNQATLNVAGAAGFGAAGVVSGNVSLNGDTLIEFGSGEITSIAGGASLAIDGANAYVADSSALASNSALTGLTSNAGTLYLENGASVSPTGSFTNDGTINVDIFSGMGGSSLAISGALSNGGRLQIGDGQLSANDSVSATSLANTGTIELDGSASNQATLNVAGAAGFGAAGVVSGNVSLNNDTLIAFGSGEITSIAGGASLLINGANARVADSSNTTSNSALTGLADNAGTFYLENGASVSTTGALSNEGTINVDIFSGEGGSSLTVGGALSNSGRLQIGDAQLSANDSVTAASLANTGTIELDGSASNQAALNVTGALTGAGAITLRDNASLQLGGSASGTIDFESASATLNLSDPADFSATLANLVIGDTIDLAGVSVASATVNGANLKIVESNGQQLTYALSNLEANTGFSIQSDTHGGTKLVVAQGVPTPPTIGAPTTVTFTGNTQSSFSGLSIADGDPVGAPLTVNISDASGILQASQFGGGTVTGDGTNALTLTGSVAEINSALASLTYIGVAVPGQAGTTIADSLSLHVADAVGQTAAASIAITVAQAPNTAPVINNPAKVPYVAGVATTLNGFALSDPYAQSIGATDALTISFPGAVLNASGAGVTVTGGGTSALTLTGTPDAINKVLLGNVSGTFSAGASAGSVGLTRVSGGYDFIDFTKTNNIQTALLSGFPTGIIYANNALNTPFDITSNQNGNNFNDVGGTLTIPVEIPAPNVLPGGGGVEEVDTLINAYNPPTGANLETVTFYGHDATNNFSQETFTLVNGVTVRDVFQTTNAGIATTIDETVAAPAVLNAFTYTNTQGGVGTGNSATGAVGTYNIDEQRFVLAPDFHTETLDKIVMSSSGAGGTPILLGVTLRETPPVLSIDTPDPAPEPDPVPPPEPDPTPQGGGNAQGDVHLTTYDGLYYNFQAKGEFVLTQSTTPGDSFQVQIRLQPWYSSASVSVITEAAIAVGSDRITFDINRPDVVWVNGVATTALTGPNSSLALNGGSVVQLSSNQYRVLLNTGETVTVTDQGSYLNISPTLPANAAPGSVKGLLGADSGQANDFQLADGTVVPQALTSAQLYGEYANAWRITDASSLLDYGPGQTTATFTDTAFPGDALALANLPANVVANAAAIVAAAGITDPTIAKGAELDYLATGDLSFITGAAQSAGASPVTQAVVTQSSPTQTAIGVAAATASAAASASGTTPVLFDLYLTNAASSDTTIDYAVIAPNSSALGAAAFGGVLPSGQVVIPTGGKTAQVEIDVPQGALGNLPSANVDLQISSPSTNPIFASSAETTLVSSQSSPTVGSVAIAPSNGALDAGKVAQFTLALDEPVAVSGSPTLQLNDGGIASYAGSGSGFTQTLVFDYTVGAGENIASLGATAFDFTHGTIANAAGAAVAASLASIPQTGPAIDTTAPTVDSIVASGVGIVGGAGDLAVGNVVDLTLNASESLFVNTANGSPTLALNDGGVASYASGSGTSALTFQYTVAAGQNTPDLAVLSAALNGAVIQDAAGNNLDLTGAATNPAGILQVNIPPAPTLSALPSLSADSQPTISGANEAGDAVSLTLTPANGPPVTVAATVNGATFGYQPTTPLADGAYSVTATQTNANGGTSAPSAADAFVIDATAPTVSIASSGGPTNQAQQTISGAVDVADAGTTVFLFDNGGSAPIGSAVVGGNGAWSAQVTLANDGVHAITASDTDAAGNTGVAGPVTFTLDTVAPTVSITSSGGPTNQALQTIAGVVDLADAGSTVSLFDNGGSSPIGSAIVGSDGRWSAQVTLAAQGVNAITAVDADAAGNSAVSAPVAYQLDSLSPTVAFAPNATFKNAHVATLKGTVADSLAAVTGVELFNNGVDLGAATIHGNGTWTFAATLPTGKYDSISAQATDGLGDTSSTPAPFELQTGIKGQSYATRETDLNSLGQGIADIYTKANGVVFLRDSVAPKPNGAYTVNYTSGSYFDSQNYFYQTIDVSRANKVLQQTLYNNDGTHTVLGSANHLHLDALGNDTMTGGGVYETFVFKANPGQETITDFHAGGSAHDMISLPAGEFASIAQILHDFTQQSGADTVITLGPHSSITLDNVNADSLTRRDFTLRA